MSFAGTQSIMGVYPPGEKAAPIRLRINGARGDPSCSPHSLLLGLAALARVSGLDARCLLH